MDARKQRFGPEALDELFEGAREIVAIKGKRALRFEWKDAGRAELEKAVIGPSGNLRAPALRVGKTWLVGFGEEAYDEVFGG